MTKSELIETLAEQHAHIPVKDVENSVKEIERLKEQNKRNNWRT